MNLVGFVPLRAFDILRSDRLLYCLLVGTEHLRKLGDSKLSGPVFGQTHQRYLQPLYVDRLSRIVSG
jgi:hypothetical protein